MAQSAFVSILDLGAFAPRDACWRQARLGQVLLLHHLIYQYTMAAAQDLKHNVAIIGFHRHGALEYIYKSEVCALLGLPPKEAADRAQQLLGPSPSLIEMEEKLVQLSRRDIADAESTQGERGDWLRRLAGALVAAHCFIQKRSVAPCVGARDAVLRSGIFLFTEGMVSADSADHVGDVAFSAALSKIVEAETAFCCFGGCSAGSAAMQRVVEAVRCTAGTAASSVAVSLMPRLLLTLTQRNRRPSGSDAAAVHATRKLLAEQCCVPPVPFDCAVGRLAGCAKRERGGDASPNATPLDSQERGHLMQLCSRCLALLPPAASSCPSCARDGRQLGSR